LTTEYEVKLSHDKKINNNLTCVHISDLHDKSFGHNQNRLINIIKKGNPDFICITGDIVDKNTCSNAKCLLDNCVKIAPTYYVPGNHEYISDKTREVLDIVKYSGAYVLMDRKEELYVNDNSICLYGIDDPFSTGTEDGYREFVVDHLEKLDNRKDEKINILLAHRPELLYVYSKYGFDIVLTGHAHGGQIRLPGGQGFIAPNQGLFPKYTNGMMKKDNTVEIISRGLGNSVLPLRINNRPEVVVIRIEKV